MFGVFLFAVSVAVTASRECDHGWVSSPLNSCYRFVTTSPCTWQASEGLCAHMGGHLVALETEEEMIWIRGYISYHPALRKPYWIGGYLRDGVWIWKEDIADSAVLVTDWAPGEPNGGKTESCLAMIGGNSDVNKWLKWFDHTCHTAYSFICEKHITG